MTTSDSHFCPKCQASINASMKFCGTCGTKLSIPASPTAVEEPASAPQVPPAPPSAAPGKPPGWLVIGGAFVILVVLVGAVSGYLFKDYLYQPDVGNHETETSPLVAEHDENPHILHLEDMPGLEAPAEEPLDVAGMGEHPDYLVPEEPIVYDDGSSDIYEDSDADIEMLDPELQLELDKVLEDARATYEQLTEESNTPAGQRMSPDIGMRAEASQPKQVTGSEQSKTIDDYLQVLPDNILKEHIDKGNQYYREKNYAMAVIEVEQAANMGHADSQRFMGEMYRDGTGVEQDYSKAHEWYEKAAGNNNPGAMYALALFYWEGQGVNKDMQKARMLFLKAATLGHAKAQYNLGIIYKEGLGTEKNPYESFHWVEKAAKQNLAEALYVIGYDYEHGEGVDKDSDKALEYYTKAAELGEQRAIRKLQSRSQ